MIRPRPPKKSETLEVRLPLAAKLAFMARCRASGLSASEVVRSLIECDGPGQPVRRRTMTWQALVAGVAGIAVGAMAAPSIAEALPGSRAAFDHLDANRDGAVTFVEFNRRQSIR